MSVGLLFAVIATLQLDGAVTADGGDYLLVPFEVPDGTVEMEIRHADGGEDEILDWGVWSPEGFRGWGGGLSDPAVIGVDESSRGYLSGPITPGEWTLVIGKAQLDGGAGTYTVEVELRDAATLTPDASAPFDPVVLRDAPAWYAGDLHVHSEESGDASATLDEISALARDRGLDFVVITDHNTVSHHDRLAAAQPALDDLLLVRGIEVTTYAGHATALGVSGYVDHRIGVDGTSATTLVDDVVAQGGLFSINHPALDLGDSCIGCAWDHADTPWDRIEGIEIQTGPYEVTAFVFTPAAIALWDAQEDAGHRLAPVGGSDDHRAGTGTGGTASPIGSPTTMVRADALSEAALRDAIAAGRTVVKLRGPDDPMVELTARTADGGEAELGETITGVGRAVLTARVTGGAGMTAELWRDGERVDRLPVDGDDATLTFEQPVSGEVERYRIEVADATARVTVTGHVYVHGDPALGDDGGGCGCAGGGDGGGPGGLALAVGVLACARRRRRR